MRKEKPNDRPAALALIGIGIIFLVVVGRGWQGLFIPFGGGISIFLGGVVAAIACALAYAIAAERVQHPFTHTTAAAYFFFLFNISALGTMNAMFVTFQSSNVFREVIEQGLSAVTKLRDAGNTYFKPKLAEYDRFDERVIKLKGALIDEILNKQNCGQGQKAKEIGQSLQELLPDFRMLSGTPNCKVAEDIAENYKQKIDSLLNNSSQYKAVQSDVDLRKKLMADEMLERLKGVDKMISANSSISSIKAELFDVSRRYAEVRLELGQKIPNANSIPERIDTSAVSAIGDIGQVLPFLVSRLDERSTYFYVAIALMLDIAVIIAFARVLRSGPAPDHRRVASSPKAL